jgi:hypothetical protein
VGLAPPDGVCLKGQSGGPQRLMVLTCEAIPDYVADTVDGGDLRCGRAVLLCSPTTQLVVQEWVVWWGQGVPTMGCCGGVGVGGWGDGSLATEWCPGG